MAAEEDKKFDAVLGGFLVNDLRVRAGHLHCPEPDVLAAYHERSLLPEEMDSWKEHIAGCARCQAILSELAASDSIPLGVSEREEKELLPEAANPVAGTIEERSAPAVPVPERPRVIRVSRGVRWQWLAPAGAVAAGLLVWVAWRENRPLPMKPPAEAKVAKAEPPSVRAPEPSTTRPAPASSSADQERSDQLARVSKDQAAIGGTASGSKSLPREDLKQFEKFDSRVRTVAPKPLADKEAGPRERDTALARKRIENEPAQDAKAGLAEAVEVQTQAANAPLQNQLNQLNAQNVGGPTPPSQAHGAAKKAKSESQALASSAPRAPAPRSLAEPAPNASAAFSELTATARLIGVPFLNQIATPNRKILWRVGSAGRIEFSSDRGASWSRQSSNVLVDLTSGSAPSDKVCWVVGRAGTILLTADAGSHWVIVHGPLDEELGGVRATDALHATIWNSLNTKSFETIDGGATWKPVALP